jgi:hypothetical protein
VIAEEDLVPGFPVGNDVFGHRHGVHFEYLSDCK